ncbi:EVE domain-containing protein [Thioflexithrix psekupsensis]|uniref:EVE domain-containing protein n=2 Tax=Thioflexithrix psekupsensis TaxID=1570016 RepID=A0A251X900_9GAMM|nr:EVE domain-containing protein [Thioflexithrix psekupsensis]
MAYWLMKSEPDVFGIDDLQRVQTAIWDGVRNYQARNFLRDQMHVNDEVLFYHSNARPAGVAGRAKVVRTAYPDPTAFDPKHRYYDPKSQPENPRWYAVDVAFVEKFRHFVTLDELRQHPALTDLLVLKRGNRLSITPMTAGEWEVIVGLGH